MPSTGTYRCHGCDGGWTEGAFVFLSTVAGLAYSFYIPYVQRLTERPQPWRVLLRLAGSARWCAVTFMWARIALVLRVSAPRRAVEGHVHRDMASIISSKRRDAWPDTCHVKKSSEPQPPQPPQSRQVPLSSSLPCM